MPDYQAITQGIRAYVRGGSRSFAEELPDLASGYATLCREANLRLRRCVEYARRGALPEAAHLAACQPELSRLVAALQFPERPQWAETCDAHGLQRPPALLDGLDEVKAAVAREAAVGPLLARHRLLATAKAPAVERLAVVRLLAKHDPDNPAWPEELERLEPARLAEMAAAATRARRTGDQKTLEKLWAELDQNVWTTDVPDELAAAIGHIGEERRRTAAAAELSDLAVRLGRLTAKPNADEAALDAAAARWKELAADFPDAVGPDVVDRVETSIDDWRAAAARRREADEQQLLGKLFRPGGQDSPGQVPVPNDVRRVMSRWLVPAVVLLALMAAAVAYFLKRPDDWARIRSFITGSG